MHAAMIVNVNRGVDVLDFNGSLVTSKPFFVLEGLDEAGG
jgi:hypothetical protein